MKDMADYFYEKVKHEKIISAKSCTWEVLYHM